MTSRVKKWALLIAGGCALVVLFAWVAVKHAPEHWREPLSVSRSPSAPPEPRQHPGSQRFHGQFGQDKWIIRRVFPGVTDGYFVDVGAGDGIDGSNTKALEDLGWTGVAIDPFPTNWEGRKCTLFREVVSSRKGEVVEFRVAGGAGGIDEHIGRWRDQVETSPLVKLTTTTIGDILERADAPSFIHYVSLDIEGAEYEALKGFPFSKYKVGAFTIEHNFEEPKRRQIRELLGMNGYRFVRQQAVDDWYLSADHRTWARPGSAPLQRRRSSEPDE